jgi:hypothetical protein
VVHAHPLRFSSALLVMTILVLGAAGASAALAGSVGIGGSVDARQPAYFSNLRVCTYPAFSLAEKRCTRDQQARILVSGNLPARWRFASAERRDSTHA